MDTNVLWWYMVKTSKNHKSIKKFLDPLILDTKNSFIVNEFVMIELIHLLIKKKGKDGYKIATFLLGGSHPFFEVKYDILQIYDLKEVLDILEKYGTTTSIGGRDASIIHSMKRYKVVDIISNDKGFSSIPNINLHDPIP
ncbi:MAG: type II toxin-antitoxin system VapC family toxin [Promethearchaeota archaeon]